MSKVAVFPIVNGQYKMAAEPQVRIGVVLREDAKKELRFRVPTTGYSLEQNGTTTPLAAGADDFYSVQCVGEELEVLAPNGEVLFAKIDSVTLQPPKGVVATQGGGVLVKDLVAGRGFHWQKPNDQTLTGELDFQARDGVIVMVNQLPLEEYLIGVITGEMSGDCPIEFLKAQCIAARSWLLAQNDEKHYGEPFTWCNDDCCQRYQGTGGWSTGARQAVVDTRAEVLITPGNHYCDARYSKNTGGISEDSENVWHEAIDCLTAVVDAPKGSPVEKFFPVTEENVREYLTGDWIKATDCFASPNVCSENDVVRYLGRVDERGSYFRWRVNLKQNELTEAMRLRGGAPDIAEVLDLIPVRRGRSGRLIQLDVPYKSVSGEIKTTRLNKEYDIRAGLSPRFLYSSAFIVEPLRNAGRLEEVTLIGGGWGHGAGFCQMGGLGRALKGQKYDEILAAYYQDVRLERIY